MPSPKSVINYPRQWIDLVNAAAVQGRTIHVEEIGGKPISKGEAFKLRFRFYSFRAALKRDPMQQDLASLSECIECTIHLAGLTESGERYIVNFHSRDANAEGMALSLALNKENS